MPFPDSPDRFLLYAITDRQALPGRDPGPFLRRAVGAGVDLVQVREKDLADGDLFALARLAVESARGSGTKILINDRLDVAIAAEADGVHLGGHSAPADAVRAVAPEGFIIGVSTHSLQEAGEAAGAEADFITFGPVFHTPSKARYGPPLGTGALREACEAVELPVLPLGGINRENFPQLLGLPVAGLAAISLFQGAPDLEELVRLIRSAAEGSR